MTAGERVAFATEQASRPLILDTVQEIRKAEPMADRPGLGRWALSVPLIDWMALKRKYPDLASKDSEIRSKAWGRFMLSDESKPYRMRDKI
jgi:hypothetical protein